MDDVFISYARKDQQFVRILYDVLQRNNRSAWVDWRDIPPSAEWLQEIYAAIESAENFIFVISPDSIVSETCALEFNYAQKLQKRIIPLICRDVDTSKAAAPVKDLQWIYFRQTDNFDAAVSQLIFALNTDLNYWHLANQILARAGEWVKKNIVPACSCVAKR